MTTDPLAGDLLRALVREVLTDIVRESLPAASPAGYEAPPADAAPSAIMPTARGGYAPVAGAPVQSARVEDVVLRTDEDLQGFALRLLGLFENPKAREDVRSGRLRFRLAGTAVAPGAAAPAGAVQRIEKGAVTERHIKAAAAAGARLALGRGAVLTPLAREKARALGVHVEKER
ncbi:hypothetical protein HC028_16820 [Planosporangium flavigriseum]|uniref:Uncharacterized protein n=1 Tax=Planosporangium flavigriseum TaxID=373681 RepID=A0A8J3PNR1_9ACTN|nr:hypothetical protein [Planosporangium flavigriseum]NJC66155.1 hypothetical protein [Planosporangium flavigriseum]GIG75153.1 hypothetical protein Pfl04_35570 [Planosporangium flavigriseum]